jgi:hypothetical protein
MPYRDKMIDVVMRRKQYARVRKTTDWLSDQMRKAGKTRMTLSNAIDPSDDVGGFFLSLM